MSRTDARRLWLIVGAAFFLRLGAAVVTETHPLFPAYYYGDASLINAAARTEAQNIAQGLPYAFDGTLSQRVQVRFQTELYRVIGIRPFAMKLLSAVLGALGVAAFALAVWPAAGTLPALMAAALCAVWPSNVFYTSQNFKEAPTNLLAYLALAALLPLASRRGGRAAPLAAAGVIFLLAAGFLRAYVMLALSAALACAFAAAWALRRGTRRRLAAGLAAALCAPAVFIPVSRLATRTSAAPFTGDPRNLPQLVPLTYDAKTEKALAPTSPKAISEFRRIRQEADRAYALHVTGREIGTQLYPDARFNDWLDVFAFLPKGAFAVLFTPLPGLSPMDGKIGRMLASAENLILLALAVLAAAGFVRGPKTPERAALVLFILAMTAGSALLEFDLGSAGRHKLLYLPMLFPFAAEEILRLFKRKEPS